MSTLSEWTIDHKDARSYYDICLEACQDDSVFSRFKTAPEYTKILSHVSAEIGQRYMDLVKQNYSYLLDDDRFLINDKLGGAPKATIDGISIDPTTLRYLKQAGDIMSFCKPISIAEIGGGYGGLQLVLRQYCDIQSYYDYDHPSPYMLATKYLSKHNIQVNDTEESEYDIVISSFAWDELHKDVREMYIDTVFSKAKNGYIVARKEISDMHHDHITRSVENHVHTSPYHAIPGINITIWTVNHGDELVLPQGMSK